MSTWISKKNTRWQLDKRCAHLAGMLPAVLFMSVLLIMMISGCDQNPRDIRMGEQECDHCRMMISEEQFVAQLITKQGRHYAFDAIECMAAFESGGAAQELDIHSLWVSHFNNPGTWLPAKEARYLQSEELRSPMAVNISAYTDREEADLQQEAYSGRVLTWELVKEVVREVWSGEYSHAHR